MTGHQPRRPQADRAHEVEEGPHYIGWTHDEVLNPIFLGFLRK